ncbi:MAG: hypothetical protein J6J17_02210 [Bacilli bacterium]|nr:hypothetical protein [Bacilli bacterium]
MSNKIRNVVLIILAIALIGMTIVYAALSQTLNITSTAKVKASTWDIHFANLSEATKVGGANVTTPPTLASTTISGLDVSLVKPGDSVSYTFDVVNNGSIDANLGTYTINTKGNGITCTDSSGSTTSSNATNVCNNLIFTLTYNTATTAAQTGTAISAGTAVAKNQKLKAGQTVKLKLTVTFNSAATSVPTSDVTISGLNSTLVYDQQ